MSIQRHQSDLGVQTKKRVTYKYPDISDQKFKVGSTNRPASSSSFYDVIANASATMRPSILKNPTTSQPEDLTTGPSKRRSFIRANEINPCDDMLTTPPSDSSLTTPPSNSSLTTSHSDSSLVTPYIEEATSASSTEMHMMTRIQKAPASTEQTPL